MKKKDLLSNSLNILKKNFAETKKDFTELMGKDEDLFKIPSLPKGSFRNLFESMKKRMDDFIKETKDELENLAVSNGIIETADGVDFIFSNLKSSSNTIKVEQNENSISVTCTDAQNSAFFEKKTFSSSEPLTILNYSSEIMPDVVVVHVKLKNNTEEAE